ncbi:MAG: type II toxin-antitoxin system RelE/ParE family toxin [Planctomycetota bacterium]
MISSLYKVVTTRTYGRTLREHGRFIAQQTRDKAVARQWILSVDKEIESLDFMPSRCVLATGYESLPYPIRRLVHHNHLILFTIDEDAKTVYVVAIVHGARLPRPGELHPSIDRVRRDTGE